MKSRRLSLFTALVVTAVGLFTTPVQAHADTYQFYDLGPDGNTGAGIEQTFVYGITDSGTVVLVYDVPVGAPLCAVSGVCQEYETFVNGVMVSESSTPPNLVYDNGAPCTPTVSFATTAIGPGVCNNGHEVYNATPVPQPGVFGTEAFDGPDITDSFAGSPPFISEIDLNSSGDFTVDFSHPAENNGEIFEAIDISTTPEPGSIMLLGTGLLATEILRRRCFQRAQ